MRWLWRKLPKSPWKRVFVLIGLSFAVFVCLVITLGVTLAIVSRSPKFQMWVARTFMANTPQFPGGKPRNGTPRVPYNRPEPSAAGLTRPGDLYGGTNVWKLHLHFTHDQWVALGPKQVPPLEGWLQPDGTPVLSNPKAERNGLAGVLGWDFPWSQAQLEFGGVQFTNVAVRYKGNGTFMEARRSFKRPFKLDLDKNVKGQKLAGRGTINLGNLVADATCLSDTLGYEFYRNAGIPAPRTTFARVFLTVDGHFENQLLGLYVSVENPDAAWTEETFGSKEAALFKPVTYEFFKDLGNDWEAYDRIYDPKTKLTPEHKQRLIEFARLVTSASDAEFARRLAGFLDLDECARFFACEVLLSNYDGIFSNGQNFLLYLDKRTGKFGFSPWDLDHAWGEFPYVATADQREKASIWHPWVGENRFLERLYGAEPFRELYRKRLQELLDNNFAPERLNARIDELAEAIRPAVAEESSHRLERFETAVRGVRVNGPRDGKGVDDGRRQAFQIKRFIASRAISVREQLEGKTKGVILARRRP